MCVNGHDPERMIERPDGRKVCGACRDAYQRRNRVRGYGTAAVPAQSAASRRDATKASNHDRRSD